MHGKSRLLQALLSSAVVDAVATAAVESACVVREKRIMKSGQVLSFCLLVLFILGSVSCSSRQPSQGPPSVSSSAQQDKQSASAPGSQSGSSKQDGISFASNPDRFVKEPTTAPPFNLPNPKTATDFFDIGVHEDNLKHYDKAITAYEQALKLKPDWALVCVREGKDYRRLNQKEKAVAQFQRAAKIDPQYWDAYSELALTYKEAGDTNHAIEAASKLLDFPPMQLPVHNQLGYWYEETGNRQKARQHFEIYRDLAAKTKSEQQTDRYEAALRELQKLSN